MSSREIILIKYKKLKFITRQNFRLQTKTKFKKTRQTRNKLKLKSYLKQNKNQSKTILRDLIERKENDEIQFYFRSHRELRYSAELVKVRKNLFRQNCQMSRRLKVFKFSSFQVFQVDFTTCICILCIF